MEKIAVSLFLFLSAPLLVSVLLPAVGGLGLDSMPGAFLLMLSYPVILVVSNIGYFPLFTAIGLIVAMCSVLMAIFYGYKNYASVTGKLLLFVAGFVWQGIGFIGGLLSA